MSSPPPPDAAIARREGAGRRDLAAAGVVGIGTALGLSWQILRLPPEINQFDKYPDAALRFLHGMSLPERLLDFSPLYLGLHIAVFRFLPDPISWVAGIQIALLALAAALLYLLLRRHAGAPFALAGAAAFALNTSIAIYGYIFEPESLMVLLLVALALAATRDGMPAAAAMGTLLTLCVLTRPTFAPLVAVIPVHLWLKRASTRRFVACVALFLLPVLAGAGFIAVRNYRLLGSPSLLVMNPGTVLFDCNSPIAYGGGAAYPPIVDYVESMDPAESDSTHLAFRRIARALAGRELTPVEVNRYWSEKVLDYIGDHPRRFVGLVARRALHVFHRHRWNDLRAEWAVGEVFDSRRFPSVPFAPVSALAVLGLAIGAGSLRTFLVPLAVFFTQASVMAVAYATDRQRVSLLPFFAFFAAIALQRLCLGGRRRAAMALALAPLTLAFSLESDLMRDDRRTSEGMSRTRALIAGALRDRDAHDFEAARDGIARALAAAPWGAETIRPARLPVDARALAENAERMLAASGSDDASARFGRALLLIEAGRLEEADTVLAALEREGRVFGGIVGRPPEPAYHRARIALLSGRRDDAVQLLHEALRRSPGDPETLAHLACLTGDSAWEELIGRYFDDLDAAFYLGRACLETGRADVAVGSFEYLLAALPKYTTARIFLAAALGAAGRDAEAVDAYLAATRERPEPVMLEERIVPSFERWAAAMPPEQSHSLGVVLRDYGRFPEALRAFERAAAAGNAASALEVQAMRGLTERR